MTSMFLFCVVVSISSVFFRVKHPLSLGLLILVLSGLSCLVIGLEVLSWYGYVVFLIYVGALLVMFAYVAALAPNPRFGLSFSHFLFSFFLGLGFFCFSFLYHPFHFSEVLSVDGGALRLNNVHLIMSSLDGGLVLVSLGALLLLVLVVVCKICRHHKGPLRLL